MRRFDVTDSLYFLVMMVSLLGGTSAAVGQDSNPCSTTDSCRRNKISYKVGAFMSGGKSIRVELFQPKAAGKYPVIILIHGSGGLLTRADAQMPREDNFGEMQIACGGYMAVLVHYFDRSGILSTVDKQYMEQESAAWLETLREAVDYASSLPKADPARIGLLGESLGGYLALSLAMRDKRIRVVSEYGGGVQLRDGGNPET